MIAPAALAVACLAAAGWPRRRWWARAAFGAAALVLLLVTAGAVINRHFDYFRTVGELFGQYSVDEQPASYLVRQRHVPRHGATVQVSIPSSDPRYRPRSAIVYVPPAWFRRPKPRLPVVVLLAGTPGTPEDWTRSGEADETTDAWAKAHGDRAPILVMPDINGSFEGDSECVNSTKYGRVETYLAVDVPRWIRRTLSPAPSPRRWAVGGLSEGATCSVWLALRHPGVWRTFASFSGLANPQYLSDSETQTITALFGGSRAAFLAHSPPHLLATRRFPQLAGWIASGSSDPGPLAAARSLATLARRAGVITCLVIAPGGHDFNYWQAAYAAALPWLAGRLGLVPRGPTRAAPCRGLAS